MASKCVVFGSCIGILYFMWFLFVVSLYDLQDYRQYVNSDFPENFTAASTSWCAPRENLILDPDIVHNCTSKDYNIRNPCIAKINSWPLADWFNSSKVLQFKDLILSIFTMDGKNVFRSHNDSSQLKSFVLDGLMCFTYDFPFQGMSRWAYFQASTKWLDYQSLQFKQIFWDYFPDGETKIIAFIHPKESPPISDKDAPKILYVIKEESTFILDYKETEKTWEEEWIFGLWLRSMPCTSYGFGSIGKELKDCVHRKTLSIYNSISNLVAYDEEDLKASPMLKFSGDLYVDGKFRKNMSDIKQECWRSLKTPCRDITFKAKHVTRYRTEIRDDGLAKGPIFQIRNTFKKKTITFSPKKTILYFVAFINSRLFFGVTAFILFRRRLRMADSMPPVDA